MSRFINGKMSGVTPYVAGEQPQDKSYIKLNTNESPFPPSPKVAAVLNDCESDNLRLYPDPNNGILVNALAKRYGVSGDRVFVGNGSDEVLAFIFMTFFDGVREVCYPNISYGFYPVYCELCGIKKNEIPLNADFTVNVPEFISAKQNVVLANPNAPTGIALPLCDVESIITANPDRLVVVDEAYADFGGESAVGLTAKYDNLIVVQTMSKSRSLAGARVGYCIANPALINDVKTTKFSFNSYNVNRLSERLGAAAIEDKEYFSQCVNTIITNRGNLVGELKKLGFDVLPSSANFVFARHSKLGGGEIYSMLKELGILVRYFNKDGIRDFVRITVGTREQMQKLIIALGVILKGNV